MEIQEKNIIAAYKVADENGQQLLRTLFPAVEFDKQEVDNRPVTERIKTFDDALAALGEDNPYVAMYRTIACNYHEDAVTAAMFAYAKLQVVVAALNEGWEPEFSENEYRWYPWFYLYTEEELAEESEDWKKRHALIELGDKYKKSAICGFAFAHSYHAPSYSNAHIGSRLCLKDENTASYCGTQFADLWADFYLIRK